MHLQAQQGLMRTFRQPWRNRGVLGWIFSLSLIAFYCLLYWSDVFQPVAEALGLSSKWYLYGALYTIGVTVGGIVYLRKHGNSRYNQLRIATNMGVQIVLGFAVPFLMAQNYGFDFYFSYFWPLKYDYLYPSTLSRLPTSMAVYAVVGSTFVAPALAIVSGKRWYCSWVCGCGALANTFGDPWRHLTASNTPSWKFEKIAVHSIMALAFVATGVIAADQLLDTSQAFKSFANDTKQFYGFFVGAVLAGVIGTGLYPLLGPRVWCRNFCPMAAILGIVQKAGRFRIRVKKDMCISCGNCTTYCEMGIDVRSYAQSNQSFTRASCVGCGMCAHVCPRGVLKLENAFAVQGDKARAGQPTVDF
ncbi:MAG: 4Fe-4S binding protein [Myxococcota bacterium]